MPPPARGCPPGSEWDEGLDACIKRCPGGEPRNAQGNCADENEEVEKRYTGTGHVNRFTTKNFRLESKPMGGGRSRRSKSRSRTRKGKKSKQSRQSRQSRRNRH